MKPGHDVALACAAFVLLAAGCQWVLPIHEGDGPEGHDSGPSSGEAGPGGPDGTVPPDGRSPGTDSAAPDTSPGNSDGGPTLHCDAKYTYHPACDQCLDTSCCAEMSACFFNNPECTALLDCISKCGFDFFTCPQKCADAHPAGVDDFNRANACENGTCGTECGHDAGPE